MEGMGRSLNTSLTLLFTLLALLLVGGETIRLFLWVLIIGVIAGTYSSIGIATPLLVVWESRRGRALLIAASGEVPVNRNGVRDGMSEQTPPVKLPGRCRF